MEPKPVVNVIMSQCSPEVEEEYNAWRDETHIPMLLEFKGLKAVTKYKLITETKPLVPGSVIDASGGKSEFLLILEFDNRQDFEAYEASPELVAALEEARTHDWRGLQEKRRRVQYELVKGWER